MIIFYPWKKKRVFLNADDFIYSSTIMGANNSKLDKGVVVVNPANSEKTVSKTSLAENLQRIENPTFSELDMREILEDTQNAEINARTRVRNHFYPLTKSALQNQVVLQSRIDESFISSQMAMNSTTDTTKQIHQLTKQIEANLPIIHDNLKRAIQETEKAILRVESLRQLVPIRSYKTPIESFDQFNRNNQSSEPCNIFVNTSSPLYPLISIRNT